jgi:hypothetical protein
MSKGGYTMMSNPLQDMESEMGLVCDVSKCTRQATYIVTSHLLDHCKDTAALPGGNKVFLFCPACTTGICRIIAERVQSMKYALSQQKNKDLVCQTCDLKVDHLSDMLSVEHLIPDISKVVIKP